MMFLLRFKGDCSKGRPEVLSNPHSGYSFNPPARQRNSTLGRVLSGKLPSVENPLLPPTENDGQVPPLTDGVEYEIEEIVDRTRHGRGCRVLVKWAHCKRLTWELRKNFVGTDALAAYEVQHGPP